MPLWIEGFDEKKRNSFLPNHSFRSEMSDLVRHEGKKYKNVIFYWLIQLHYYNQIEELAKQSEDRSKP